MSTPSASGLTPTPQTPQIGELGGAGTLTETRTITPTTTTQTERVNEVAIQALTPPSTNHEVSSGKLPQTNVTGKVESQSSADQKTDKVAQKIGIEHPAEKLSEDEVAFIEQRSNKNEVKEGWLDLSDDEERSTVSSTTKTPNQTATTFVDDTESLGIAQLFEGVSISSGKEGIELAQRIATTLVRHPDHVTCFHLHDTGARLVDHHSESSFIIDHKNKVIICKDPDAMGQRSGGQVKACAQDLCKAQGLPHDLSDYGLHVADEHSKEIFMTHLDHAVGLIETLEEKIQELKHFPNPSIQANHVSPNMAEVTAAKSTSQATDTTTVDHKPSATTKTATKDSVKQLEETARQREREILKEQQEDQKAALRKELFQKSYEIRNSPTDH